MNERQEQGLVAGLIILLMLAGFYAISIYPTSIGVFSTWPCERMLTHDKIDLDKYWNMYEEKCLT